LGFESTVLGNLVNQGSIEDRGRTHTDPVSGYGSGALRCAAGHLRVGHGPRCQ
jgi:hypothetical protein